MKKELYQNIVFAAIFAGVGFWLLGIDGANYLRKIDLLSIFLNTKEYFADCMAYPGGLLVWCSTYLTQTFYHPILGAIIYIILLLAMGWLALKAFGMKAGLFPVTLLLPAIELTALLNFGYLIFSLKSPGYAFNLPLATDIILLTFWGYRALRPWALRIVAMLIIPIAGYCLMGYYGLMITAMCVIYEITRLIKGPERLWIAGMATVAIGVLATIFVPKIWFSMIGGDLPKAIMYRYPLPYFYENEGEMWTPYKLLFVLMIIGSALPAIGSRKKYAKKPSKLLPIATCAVGVIAIAGIFVYRYTDRNFSLTLDLANAIEHQQWEQAYEIAQNNQDIDPTRVNVVLTYIAMQHMGIAADQTFKLRAASAPFNTTRDLRATHDIVAMPLAYHTGLANYAYRWAVEYAVEYGRSVERLKYMVKSALLNKDYALARKSLDNLSKTTFHKKWAEKYYTYLDNPDLIESDPEMGYIIPLIGEEDKFLDDNNQLEGYVWKAAALRDNGKFPCLEIALTSALICFKPDIFAEKAPLYAQKVKDLPVHFQEAVLIWSYLKDEDYYKNFNIDATVMQRFELFKNMYQQVQCLPPDMQKERMRPMFGDTYWYYCLFVSDMKVI